MTKRVLSAIAMVLIFVPLLFVGGLPFNIFMSILGLCALYELIHMKESKKRLPLLIKLFAYVMVIFFTFSSTNVIDFQFSLDYRIMSVIIFAFLSPLVFINNREKYSINDALYLISSVLFIGLSFNLIIVTRNYDLKYIIYLLLITTITDTFALFTGMLVGNHKLTSISPKKTYEGMIGITLITIMLSLVGQLGDLVFSSIKRYYDKKDFSDLIPGHGGILDRFDSIIFVVLAFIIVLGII